MKKTWKDKIFEIYLSVILTAGVSALGFLYSTIYDLNAKMSIIVEKVTQHDTLILTGTTAMQALEIRMRGVEIEVQTLLDKESH